MADAHHEYWIERDANRTGEISVGRRGACLHGGRMRRECPNDRRPTRPTANSGVPAPAQVDTAGDIRPPGAKLPLTAPRRSASRRFAPAPSAAAGLVAAATARSRLARPRRLPPPTATPTTTVTWSGDDGVRRRPRRCAPRAARTDDGAIDAAGAAQADGRGPGHRSRPPNEHSCASHRSATPGLRHRSARSGSDDQARPAAVSQPGERAKGDGSNRDKPKADRQVQPAAAAMSVADADAASEAAKKKRRRSVKGPKPATARSPPSISTPTRSERRRGRERNGRPIGRYLMAVQVRPTPHPGRRARGPQPDRALRQPPGRRRQPDPRQHLPRQGAERAARHGGRVRRHRHARRTPCSTAATCSTTPRTSSRRRGQTCASSRCCGPSS